MAKILIMTFILFFSFTSLIIGPTIAQNNLATVKILPPPDTKGGIPLMAALANRKASRSFSGKSFTDDIIGNMLWAGFGVNRPDGRRTAPTARNVQDLDIYILLSDGVWRYEAKDHSLINILNKDIRNVAGSGDAILLYVADTAKAYNEITAAMHAGSIYQNVGLYCASAGLNNVVRLSFDSSSLSKAMNLPATSKIIISQAVGFP